MRQKLSHQDAAVTGLSLGNAIVLALSEALISAGVLSPTAVAAMVLEVAGYVHDATERSSAVAIADVLCGDIEAFAAEILKREAPAHG